MEHVQKNRRAEVRISKALTFLLRHGESDEEVPLKYDKYGGVDINEILQTKQLKGVTRDSIYKIVESNSKKRFTIYVDDDGIERICAVQGHSFQVEPYLSEKITRDNLEALRINPETVVHGTYKECLEPIMAEGLSRMGRNNIHFGLDIPEFGAVISGMRKSCNVIIFIDILAALDDGFEFILSNNRVVLTPGNEKGYLPVKYFSKIVDRVNMEAITL